MHEGALGVHEVELVVQAGEDLGDGGGVGDHAHSALHLGQVATCAQTQSQSISREVPCTGQLVCQPQVGKRHEGVLAHSTCNEYL